MVRKGVYFFSVELSHVKMYKNEPPHDKTNSVVVRAAKLRSAWAPAQADLRLRWAHSHFVGFVMSRLKYGHHDRLKETATVIRL